MKKYTMYECEYCGKQSKAYRDIADCESEHLALSYEDLVEYQELKEAVKGSQEALKKQKPIWKDG